MTLEQSISWYQLSNTLLFSPMLRTVKAAQDKKYGNVLHIVIQGSLNILVAVTSARGINVTSSYTE